MRPTRGSAARARRILTTRLGLGRTKAVRILQILRFVFQEAPNERGTVMVEYTVLLSVVAVGLSLALAALGVPLVSMYLSQQTWLLLPFP